MIDEEFASYRAVADGVEDEFYKLNMDNEADRAEFLRGRLSTCSGPYEKIAILRLLCQELAVLEVMRGPPGLAREKFDELFALAHFDPLSLISCAEYYSSEVGDLEKAKYIALYAAFVAEHTQAFVRHAHQTIIRVAGGQGDLGVTELSVRRLTEYIPAHDSPDPAIEADVVRMVGEMSIDPTLKAAFVAAASR